MKKFQANLEHVAVAVIVGEGVKGVIHFRQVGATIQADDDYFGLAMQFQRLLKFWYLLRHGEYFKPTRLLIKHFTLQTILSSISP